MTTIMLTPDGAPEGTRRGAPGRGWKHLLWVACASFLGFMVPAFFAGWLQLPRNVFLIPHALAVSFFTWSYVRWSGVDLGHLFQRHWQRGLLGAVVAGALLIANILQQPARPHPGGPGLAFDVLWGGVVYGMVDTLLLTVIPMVAVWRAAAGRDQMRSYGRAVAVGGAALLASLLVTAAYHAGFPEFRGPSLVAPLIGNGLLGLAYLLTGNALAPVGAHGAMHVAAVLHGAETAVQLPPHYPGS